MCTPKTHREIDFEPLNCFSFACPGQRTGLTLDWRGAKLPLMPPSGQTLLPDKIRATFQCLNAKLNEKGYEIKKRWAYIIEPIGKKSLTQDDAPLLECKRQHKKLTAMIAENTDPL
jgi:hypothetical protein